MIPDNVKMKTPLGRMLLRRPSLFAMSSKTGSRAAIKLALKGTFVPARRLSDSS